MQNLKILQKIIDYAFNDENLLLLSLTHASYAHEHNQNIDNSNQRLEFLGDAVLELISSDFLYNHYNDNEGMLTRYRSHIVCADNLADVAKKLKLYDYLLVGNGKNIEDIMNNKNIMSDTLEALIGAIYLDGGFEEASKFINNFILNIYDFDSIPIDYKSELQEIANRDKVELKYELLKEMGPDHDKSFVVGLNYNGTLYEEGFGKSKKEAERNAAKLILEKLK